MHAISSYRGNRPTKNKLTHSQTNPHTGPIAIHCAAKHSVITLGQASFQDNLDKLAPCQTILDSGAETEDWGSSGGNQKS